MLNDLRQYENWGTPNFYIRLIRSLQEKGTKWNNKDVQDLFYNKTIDGRIFFQGCIRLALTTNTIIEKNNSVSLSSDLIHITDTDELLIEKFLVKFLSKLGEDELFLSLFDKNKLSFDVKQKSIAISHSAFGFKFGNLKQFLIDFNIITKHPIIERSVYLLNSKYSDLFKVNVLKKNRQRKITVEELKARLEKQSKEGEEAEFFVLGFEMKRLKNRKDIDWVAKYVANEGYDIASFNLVQDTNFNRFIEVKSFKGGNPYFYWSRNEVNIAKRKKDEYWIYIVDRSKIASQGYSPMMIQNPSEKIFSTLKWKKRIEGYRFDKV